MYQELQSKVTEEKPSYSREEIQWLLEHLGDPSPEIRDDLFLQAWLEGFKKNSLHKNNFISLLRRLYPMKE